jgi:hypothetical protein
MTRFSFFWSHHNRAVPMPGWPTFPTLLSLESHSTEGAPSYRVLCERVGGSYLNS